MNVKLLSEVQARDNTFLPQWNRAGDDVLAQNLRFGRLWHGVVCKEDGSPQYDLPVWVEPVGAVCVPIAHDGRIALLEQFRPIPRRAGVASWPPPDLSTSGRVSWELPRGFPESGETPNEVARREAEEELGWVVDSVEHLGECNANTTYFVAGPQMFLVRVDPRRSSTAQPDQLENIRRVELLSWEEVLTMIVKGKIFCGFTLAALAAYHARIAGGVSAA